MYGRGDVNSFGTDYPILRAVTYFDSGRIAIVGDCYPASVSSDLDFGFEATSAFRCKRARTMHLTGLLTSIDAPIVILEPGIMLNHSDAVEYVRVHVCPLKVTLLYIMPTLWHTCMPEH